VGDVWCFLCGFVFMVVECFFLWGCLGTIINIVIQRGWRGARTAVIFAAGDCTAMLCRATLTVVKIGLVR